MENFTLIQFFNGALLIVSLVLFVFGLFKSRSDKIDIDPEKCSKTWERVFAAIYDMILLSIIYYVLSTVAKLLDIMITDKFEKIFTFIFAWLYFCILESSNIQGSIGKIMQGLKVTDTKGRRITFVKANKRYFAKFFSVFSILLGLLQIPFLRYKQALHDSLANTLVMKRL